MKTAAVLATLTWAAAMAAERRVISLAADGDLTQQGLFDIAFEPGGKGGVSNVWIAASNGLHSYDGFLWKRYGVADGLPSDFVRCVAFTRSGDLWVGTDKGAGVFRPHSFETRGSPGGLAGPNVRRIIEDSRGALWFTSDSWPNAKARGGIARLKDGVWKAWHAEDGLPSDYVVNQLTDRTGRVFAMTLNGPAHLERDRWVAERVPRLSLGKHWGSSLMVDSPALGPVLTNGHDVFVERAGAWVPLGSAPPHQYGLVAADGQLLMAADTAPARKAFAEWNGQKWQPVSEEFSVPHDYGEEMRRAPDGSVWCLGFGFLVRWPRQHEEWTTLAQNPPGAVLGGAKGGLWAFQPDLQPAGLRRLHELKDGKWIDLGRFRSVALDASDGIWAAGSLHVSWLAPGRTKTWDHKETGFAHHGSITVDGEGTPWLLGRGAERQEAAAYFDGGAWHARPIPELGTPERVEHAPALPSGLWCLAYRGRNDDARALVLVTKTSLEQVPLPTPIPAFEAALHAGHDGTLWLFGDTGLHRLDRNRRWTRFDDLPARHVRSAGLQPGRSWFTMDSLFGGTGGLFRLTSSGRKFYPARLSVRFSQSADGTLVTGSPGRLWVVPPAGDAFEIRTPDRSELLSAFRDSSGAYVVATTSSLMRFRPDGIPPKTQLMVRSDAVLSGQPFTVEARARERFLPPGDSLGFEYSWRLDNQPWTKFERSAHFQVATSGLEMGTHRIAVRARDNGQDMDMSQAAAQFRVHQLPVQERPWFAPALVLITAAFGFAAIAALRARRKLSRQAAELETRVKERTATLEDEVARRAAVEAELRHSDRRYREIVETAQEGIAVFDPEGRCQMANREFSRIVGCPLEQLPGRQANQILGEDAAALMEQRFRRAGSEAAEALELTLSPVGCEPRLVAISGRPIPGLGVPSEATLVAVVDNTIRRKHSEALRQSEASYRGLFEANPNAAFVVDLETLRFLLVNSAAISTYGYSAQEFQSICLYDLQQPGNVELARQMLAEPMLSRRRWSWKHRRKDGSILDVEIAAQDIDFQGRKARLVIAVDTTERSRAAAALHESEANLLRAQRLAQLGSFQYALDEPARPAAAWSAEMDHILGIESAGPPPVLAALAEMVHPEDRDRWRNAAEKASESGHPVEFEHRVVRPGGAIRYLRTTLVRDVISDVPGLTGTVQDITDRRMLEEQLWQSQKLESIGQLAGGIAHDFNNLLTVINGYSGRILGKLDPAGSLHGDARQILTAGKQAAALTKQLLAFGRRQAFHLEVVDLNAAVNESREMLARLMGERIELLVELHGEPLPVSVDPSQIQQVLLNLTVNARDAMPGGGTLRIRTLAIEPGGVRRAALEVIDSGEGMTEEVRSRIFEPFFTTKGRSGGTGLGLATVYGIVRQSGGEIQVESRLGSGSVFRAMFPLANEAPGEPAKASEHETAAPGSGTILLVEDQREVRELAAEVLRAHGYRVLDASSGPVAMAMPEGDLAAVDLLVTDVIMPGMTGVELAEALRARHPGLRVLFVSGYTADVIREVGPDLMLLEKPFTAEALVAGVRSAMSVAAGPHAGEIGLR
ncbi:MAG: PAS domain S-box protein [Bryobacteraceae bacterium]